ARCLAYGLIALFGLEARYDRFGLPRFAPIQYFSATTLIPFNEARSSYFPLFDRLGSLTFSCRTFLYGMRLRMCEMQLRRARFLSSKEPTARGAWVLSVVYSTMPRALKYSPQRGNASTPTGLISLPRSGFLIPPLNPLPPPPGPPPTQPLNTQTPP